MESLYIIMLSFGIFSLLILLCTLVENSNRDKCKKSKTIRKKYKK